jgi:putative DNA primase/helicase
MESFMHKDRHEIRNDLAALAGSRCVCALEGQEGRRLAESLVKQLTGGVDAITARFLFQEPFDFQPQFKVFLGTNHKPKVSDDDALWERIKLVPFVVQIPKGERDKELETKLHAELPGILAWAVRGCLAWYRQKDLGEPDAVTQATTEYRAEMDTLAHFLEECCETNLKDAAKVKASLLAHAYQGWCKRTGNMPLAKLALIKALEAKGFTRHIGHANQYYWHGVGLAAPGDEGEN